MTKTHTLLKAIISNNAITLMVSSAEVTLSKEAVMDSSVEDTDNKEMVSTSNAVDMDSSGDTVSNAVAMVNKEAMDSNGEASTAR